MSRLAPDPTRVRHLSAAIAVSIALLATACGGGGDTTTPPATAPATTNRPSGGTAVPGTSQPKRTAAPRWETVTTFGGTGTADTAEFVIVPTAIQWRVRWSCESGQLRITSTPPPRRNKPVVESACPNKGEGFAIHTGAIRLRIETPGPWTAVVDQQIDTVLDEPAPAGITGGPLGTGQFYDVEKEGSGTAILHRLAGGRRVLRFEGFEVTNNTDLFVWLLDVPAPRTSAEAVKAERVVLANLKSTVGNQNYEIPAEVPDTAIRSVVIWCQPVAIVYSAASLER